MAKSLATFTTISAGFGASIEAHGPKPLAWIGTTISKILRLTALPYSLMANCQVHEIDPERHLAKLLEDTRRQQRVQRANVGAAVQATA